MRLVAASMVIFSHSYDLLHLPPNDWFSQTGQFGAAYLAVRIFFILSGFLIAKSALESNSLSFWKKRLFRIFPALWVVVILTVFVLGPFFTRFTLSDYFKNPVTFGYLKNASAFWLQYTLPGVFDHYHHIVAINGSLWTLFYELTFYGLVWALANAGLLKSKAPTLLIWLGFLVTTLVLKNYDGGRVYTASLPFFREIGIGYRLDLVLDLGLFYLSGVILFKLFPQGINSWPLGIGALVIYIISIFTPFYGWVTYASLPIIILFLGTFKPLVFENPLQQIGDFSYGIYIYAFPVQQIVIELGRGHHWNPVVLSWISLAASIPLAIASYRLIERPAMRLIRNKKA